MKILTTSEALEYIAEQTIDTAKRTKPLHKNQLHRWRKYGWLERHEVGTEGRQTTYTQAALDTLCIRINKRGSKP